MSSNPTRKNDRSAAVTLEVPPGVADDIEGVLRGYAEEAELDTSLVVDHSGFLIAGISSVPDVDVDTIGALVAGASGATEDLTGALGEMGQVESLHLGEDRLLYLKEVGERYILVGVSDSNIPAGILRDQANFIEPTLIKHLQRVKALPMSLTKTKPTPSTEPEVKPEPPKSLRQSTPPTPEPQPQKEAEAPAKVQPAAATDNNPPPAQVEKISGTVGGVASTKPAASKKEVLPESVFETQEAPKKQEPPAIAAEPKRVETHAVVENSPFEMDDEDEDDTNFKPVRPNTTPVHLSVPAARQREAAARKKNDDDDDQQSGPRYSFELG